ncbi:MAG TPA: Ig-like domain-containing protein [Gemmatimonadota bacterium]|nr:Ig-like domain-containing protein [Gemmatimonadota bacterium]
MITKADFEPPLSTVEGISAALDLCNDNGDGQGTAASTRFENGIRKFNSGDIAGGQSSILSLLQWEYERVDLGKWLCSPDEFVEIMTAMVQRVDLDIPITWDGGLCTGDQVLGCKVVTNDGCAGVLTPDPAGKVYYISFDEITDGDPFDAKFPIFNSYPRWSDIHVFDIDGGVVDPADFPVANPAIAAIVTQGTIPVPVPEEGLVLGHLKNEGTTDEEVELLPPAFLDLLSCNQTADAGPLNQFAALFQVSPLFALGSKAGALTSFSPIGLVDGGSNTQVGIEPAATTLTDLQSVTLTATVSGVDGVDTDGGVYPATPILAGDPLRFVIDGVPMENAVTTSASGQATLTLTCGSDLDSGDHEIGVEYYATDTHAESSTSDADSPTGVATVTCTTPFKVINFDRDPNDNPLKNGEIVDNTYAPSVVFTRTGGDGTTCASGHVFAVSEPNSGNFGSPPRVVSLCDASSAISSTTHGWVRATFASLQSEVCIAVFPTTKVKNPPQGRITAYYTNGSSASTTGQGKLLCVAKKGSALIRYVEFSGYNGVAKFDNLRYR